MGRPRCSRWVAALAAVSVGFGGCPRDRSESAAPEAGSRAGARVGTPAALSPDSAQVIASASEALLRARRGDTLFRYRVVEYRRDSGGSYVVGLIPTGPGAPDVGGGGRVRVWPGDSATLLNLFR